MSGPYGNAPPPPPPADTSGATWTPPPPGMAPMQGYAPYPPMAAPKPKMTPERMGEMIHANSLAFWAQAIGFLLVFIGTVLAIFWASPSASCYASGGTCSTASDISNTVQSIDWAIMLSKFLWALGLFGIAAGCGLHLRFTTVTPTDSSPEATRIFLARRRGEFVMFVIALLLLFLLLTYSWATLPGIPVPAT
jgi:hypothetical protein